MNIRYIFSYPLKRNVFLFLILISLCTITAQTKSISLLENYPKANHPSVLTTNGHVNTDSLIQYLTNSSSKTYTWSINKNNSWEDLKNSLPEFENCWHIHICFFNASNKCFIHLNHFGFDFIRWAKEIANLSLRYSNLKDTQLKFSRKC